MTTFEIEQLISERTQSGGSYLEFLREPSMSLGVSFLPAGGVDPQKPHKEDEVYYVVSGVAIVRVETEDRPVRAGSVVFVKAFQEHRFHSIEEDLTLLVFFAPAESS